MTEADLPEDVQDFVNMVRIFGGEVEIDYEHQSIAIRFDAVEKKKRFISWAETVMDVNEQTFH
jgi:hypothetical protein